MKPNWPSLSDDPTGTTSALAWGCCWCFCLCLCGLDLALPSGAWEACALEPGTDAAADERNIELLSPALMELFKCSIVASVNTSWNACCSIVQISSASAWMKEERKRQTKLERFDALTSTLLYATVIKTQIYAVVMWFSLVWGRPGRDMDTVALWHHQLSRRPDVDHHRWRNSLLLSHGLGCDARYSKFSHYDQY